MLWDKVYGGSGSDVFSSLTQTVDGGYLLGGSSISGISGHKSQASKGAEDFWVIKLDVTGAKMWDKTIGGTGSDGLRTLARTSDGGYVIGGASASGISGDKTQPLKGINDYWLVKLDGLGNLVWDKGIGGSSNNWLLSLYQVSGNSYILAGISDSGISGDKTQANQGNWDYWMIKLDASPAVGIAEAGHGTADFSAFPNPNQGSFRLALHNLKSKSAAIQISDILGRIVYHQELPVHHNQLVHAIALPKVNGMYQVTVKTGNETLHQKIMVE